MSWWTLKTMSYLLTARRGARTWRTVRARGKIRRRGPEGAQRHAAGPIERVLVEGNFAARRRLADDAVKVAGLPEETAAKATAQRWRGRRGAGARGT